MTTERDKFLTECRDTRCGVVVFTTNGFQLRGVILSFDGKVIVLQREDGKNAMVYQSAISTIIGEYLDLSPKPD